MIVTPTLRVDLSAAGPLSVFSADDQVHGLDFLSAVKGDAFNTNEVRLQTYHPTSDPQKKVTLVKDHPDYAEAML
ncbi:hypothetical protein GYB43_08395 [bacterium]|nr:hypothetical protein [bacterium]